MKFGTVPIGEAAGAIAAHSVRAGAVMVKKGQPITPELAAELQQAGVAEIVAVRLEEGDLDENAAATRLGEALKGGGLRAETAFTGRVNLFAEAAGVLTVDAAAIDAINAIDESITVATLPAMRAVVAGEMVATIKIIPYAVPETLIAQALVTIGDLTPIAVAAYMPQSVAVISTLLPGLKPSVVDKTLRVMAERLAPTGAAVLGDVRVAHAIEPLAEAIAVAAKGPAGMIVVFGASAITDRRDVIPQALLAAGGTIGHLGMPVDPGNLLLTGRIAGKPFLGAPGCARSPKENGFDWVLQRFLAGLPVTARDIQGMGVGGLLMEIVSRPQPRAPAHEPSGKVAGIVLAAGRSSRMGGPNKLLQEFRGKPLLRHAVEAQIEAGSAPVIVVTGHQGDEIRAAMTGLDVTVVPNPDFASGMASSLKAGIAALPNDAPAVVVSLADMPQVTGDIIRRLGLAFADRPDALAAVPTLLGKRGNPVLLARGLFPEIAKLGGDEGARRLLDGAGEALVEVVIDDPAIARDIDTPDALARLREEEP